MDFEEKCKKVLEMVPFNPGIITRKALRKELGVAFHLSDMDASLDSLLRRGKIKKRDLTDAEKKVGRMIIKNQRVGYYREEKHRV